MKHIMLLFITIALFFANIGSAYSSFTTFNFLETKEYTQIIDTCVFYASQKLHSILNCYSKLDLSKKETMNIFNYLKSNLSLP